MAWTPTGGVDPPGITWAAYPGFPSPHRFIWPADRRPLGLQAEIPDLGIVVPIEVGDDDYVKFVLSEAQTVEAIGKEYVIVDSARDLHLMGRVQRSTGRGGGASVTPIRTVQGAPIKVISGVPGPKGEPGDATEAILAAEEAASSALASAESAADAEQALVALADLDERKVESVVEAGGLVLDGAATSHATAPHTAAMASIVDLDARWFGETDWTLTGITRPLVAKWRTNSTHLGWTFHLTTAGRLGLSWSPDGNAPTITVTSTVNPPTAATGLRATIDVDNGAGGHTVTFYAEVNGAWQTVGAPVVGTGATTVYSSNTAVPLSIGATNVTTTPVGGITATVRRIEVRNGIGGTIVASPDFTTEPWTPDAQGNVWTLTGGATVDPPARYLVDRAGPFVPDHLPDALARDQATRDYIDDRTFPGGLTVTALSGDRYTIDQSFNGGTLTQTFDRYGSLNGAFNFVGSAIDGVTFHSNGDDVTPVRTFTTVGGNHGYTSVFRYNATGHDKTTADLGSIYTDGTHTYTLLIIDGANLTFAGGYTVTNGITTAVATAPAANLTHVSGGTNTATVADSTRLTAAQQLYPSVRNVTVDVTLDGRPVTGSRSGRELLVTESYEILDYKALIDWAQANVGQSYIANRAAIAGTVRLANTFRWTPGGTCLTSHSVTALGKVAFINSGFLQSSAMSRSGHTLTRYMPSVAAKSGYDFPAIVDMTSYATTVVFTAADLLDPTKPPDRSVDWLTASGARLVGFTMGYTPDKTDSSDTARLANITTHFWDMRNQKKNYPNAISAGVTLEPGERLGFQGYRSYLDPQVVGAATNLNVVTDAASTYIYLDTHTATTVEVPLPEAIGAPVDTVHSNGVDVLTDTVGPDGVVVTTAGYGTACLRVPR